MSFKIGSTINVNDSMQQNYSYMLTEPTGRNFPDNFKPYYTPKQMLKMGVFEGKYLNECINEFPKSWFVGAKLCDKPNIECNYFKVKSRDKLKIWKKNGWIQGPDVRGWFQWYCRYYLGRRLDIIDEKQIRRWSNFTRHETQIRNSCKPNDLTCRPKQRQSSLQWSHNPFI